MPNIFQLWTDADPDTWNANGNVASDPDNPVERLFTATGDPDQLTSHFWDAAGQNGITQ